MFKRVKTLHETAFELNPSRMQRGINVMIRRHPDGREVISIHRVFSCAETSNPSFDGWSNHDTIEEARAAWKKTVDNWKQNGWVERPDFA